MKKLLFALVFLSSFSLQAQVSTTFDRIFRQDGGPGLTPRRFTDADSALNRGNATKVNSLSLSVASARIWQRIKTAAAKAAISNPLITTPITTLTVTVSNVESTTGIWAGSPEKKQLNTYNPLSSGPVRYVGGKPEVQGGGVRTRATATGPTGSAGGQVSSAIEFWTDATYVMWASYTNNVAAMQYRIIVNDRPVSTAIPATQTFPYNNATNYVTIEGLTGISKVRIEVGAWPTFQFVKYPANTQMWPTESENRINTVFEGDSYLSSSFASSFPHNNWCNLLGYKMGWDITSNSIGGTGYISDNSGTQNTFGSTYRLNELLNQAFDLIIFFGTINDPTDATAIQNAALAAWQGARSRCPNTPIIIIGVPANSLLVTTAQGKEAGLLAAFQQWNDPNSYFIPLANPANGRPAFNGSNGNGAQYTQDGVHLSNSGSIYLEARLEAELQKILNAIP